MPRSPDPRIKAELVERVSEQVLRGGLVHASLDTIAAAAGTSKRVLVYHFGGREELLFAIVGDVERRWMTELEQRLGREESPQQAVMGLWRSLTTPHRLRIARTVFELWLSSLDAPEHRSTVQRLLGAWTDRLATILGGRPAAVLLLATVNGLLLARASGQSQRECDAALETLLSAFERKD